MSDPRTDQRSSRRIIPKPDLARIMADVFGAPSAAAPAERSIPVLASCAGRTHLGRCWGPVVLQVASIPMCSGHLEEMKAGIAEVDQTGIDERFRVVARAVVYYMGDPESGQVKIGTTTQLRHRFMSLSSLRRKLVLLATEPGSRALERQRHRQFRALHQSGEWFRKASILMDHIGALRVEHGILLTGDGEMPSWGVAPLRKSPGKAEDVTPQTADIQGKGMAL